MAHGSPARRKSTNNNENNNCDIDEIPAPPDGGWGWVVVIASFLIHIVTDGITYSFGILYVAFLEEFKEGKAYTSWIVSILVGMTLCSGPISSTFVNKYGCRSVTIAGSIWASACLLCSMFANNVLTLIITIGFGVGIGLGLIYLPAIVSVTTYFEKYRSVATGIAVAGSGLGTFLFSPLIDYLVATHGWRGTMMVLSAIVLCCTIFGSLFRPLKSSVEENTANEEPNTYQTDVESSNGSIQNGHANGAKHRLPSPRIPSVHVIAESSTDGQIIRSQSVGHSMAISTKGPNDSKYLLNVTNHHNGLKNGNKSEGMRYTLSQPLLANTSADGNNKSLRESHKHWRSGTLSRPDIFYQGSLYNIRNFKSHTDLQMETNRYGSFRRIDENENVSTTEMCCGCIPADSMMNFSLLKDPIFILYTLSNFATSLGFNVPYVYLTDQAKEQGLSPEQGSYLIAIIGMANTFGRIILGYLSDKPWVNRLWIYNTCLTLCGLATALSVFCVNFYTLAFYAIIFGFTIGAYVGLTSVILVDLLGLDNLTNAFGILLLFQGIASFVGPPIVGLLYDVFESYTSGFIFAGSMIAISGLMLYPIPTLQRYLHQRHTQPVQEQPELAVTNTSTQS